MHDDRYVLERFYPYYAKMSPYKMLRVKLRNIKDSDHIKEVILKVGDKVSLLCIDTRSEIGSGKEYVVEGMIKQIVLHSHKNSCCGSSIHGVEIYKLVIDCSKTNMSRIKHIKTTQLLDIHFLPYTYDLNETTLIMPRVKDGIDVITRRPFDRFESGNRYDQQVKVLMEDERCLRPHFSE